MILNGAVVNIDSRGQILYRQTRVGLDGRTFRIFKFRTMIPDAENCGLDLACASDVAGITRAVAGCAERAWMNSPNSSTWSSAT